MSAPINVETLMMPAGIAVTACVATVLYVGRGVWKVATHLSNIHHRLENIEKTLKQTMTREEFILWTSLFKASNPDLEVPTPNRPEK